MLFTKKLLLLFTIGSLRFSSAQAALSALNTAENTQAVISDAFVSILKFGNTTHKIRDVFLSVGYNVNNTDNKYIFEDLVGSIIQQMRKRPIDVKFHSPLQFISYEHAQLTIVDDLESLRFLYKNLVPIGTRNLAYTLVFISSIKTPTDPQITDTLQLLWQMHVLNVGLIIPTGQSGDDDLVMITYFPYSPKNCEVIKPKLVNYFNAQRRRWQFQTYFPEKTKNFHGCPMVVATWEDMPYLRFQRNFNNEIEDYIGFEGHLLKFIAENLNFTIETYLLNANEITRTFNETYALFGEVRRYTTSIMLWSISSAKIENFPQLFRKNIKFGLGAFHYRSDLYANSTFSQPQNYYISNVYLVINIIYQKDLYKILFRPLQSQVWLVIGLVFASGYAVICALRFGNSKANTFVMGHGNSSPYYNMFVIFIGGQCVNPVPQRNFARYLLMLWLTSTIVLRGSYQSGIFAILRDQPTEDPPNTLKAVAAQNYVIEMIPENVRFLQSLPEVKHVRFLNHSSELQEFPGLATSLERTALLTPYEYFGHFRKMNHSLSRGLILVKERIFAQPLSFYIQRNSFLVDLFDKQIAWAKSLGFLHMWSALYVDERSESELGNEHTAGMRTATHSRDSATGPQAEVKPNILSLNELEAIFRMCGCMLLIACGIFTLELFYAKCKNTIYLWAIQLVN